MEISESSGAEVIIEILGKYTCPLLIEYTGKLQGISIVFKPLGLNYFFRDNYQSIAPQFSQALLKAEWQIFGQNLFSGDDDLVRLETFLISQFRETSTLSTLEKSLSILEHAGNETALSELAARLGLHQKAFQRHFKKHIGCSPVEYRRICRFRNSVASRLNSSELKTLTDLTYESGFFDQSYFIKEFRKLTTHNPKDFFKLVNQVDGEKIVWKII